MRERNLTIERRGWRLNELEAAYGMKVSFWRKEIRAKRLRAKKFGGAVVVLDEDLKNYLEAANAN